MDHHDPPVLSAVDHAFRGNVRRQVLTHTPFKGTVIRGLLKAATLQLVVRIWKRIALSCRSLILPVA